MLECANKLCHGENKKKTSDSLRFECGLMGYIISSDVTLSTCGVIPGVSPSGCFSFSLSSFFFTKLKSVHSFFLAI